jgi:hypothetical protein
MLSTAAGETQGCRRLASGLSAALSLLVAPKLAVTLARRGWGEHLLNVGSVRLIESEGFYNG